MGMRTTLMVALTAASCGPVGQSAGSQPPGLAPPIADSLIAQGRAHENARLRTQASADPVALLAELGVPVEKYEGIARELYVRWARAYPEEHARRFPSSRPAPTPVSRPPVVQPIPTEEPPRPSLGESLPWWCVTSTRADQCEPTKAECDGRRALLGGFAKCEAEQNALLREACISNAARLADLSTCQWQQHAACFERTRVLGDSKEFACSSSMTACNERRAFAMKELKADFKVTSACVAR